MTRSRALAAGIAVALLLSGCGDDGDRRSAAYGPGAPPPDGCGEVERPPEQSGGHLIGDATPPVPYSSTPPTSGWHASGFPERGVHDEAGALSEPEQVTILELGGIVITWNGLDAQARAALEELIAPQAEVVAGTPYGKLPEGQLAVAAWGVLQRCGAVDTEAIQEFIDEHQGGGPDH